MNWRLLILSFILNTPIFFLCRDFIVDKIISASEMNIILVIISALIIIEHFIIFITIYIHIKYFSPRKRPRYVVPYSKFLNNAFYINIMVFVYLFYGVVSLTAVVFYPTFPNIFGLFVLIFVFHYFFLAPIILGFVHVLIEIGFRYHLKDLDKVKKELRKLSPEQGFSYDEGNQNHGENRLSDIEINAIDDIFKKTMRKELRRELKPLLYRVLLRWSRLLSLANAIILSLLLNIVITWHF